MAIDGSGNAYSWGNGLLGVLGIGIANISYCNPAPICGGINFCKIDSGAYRTACGINNTGQAYCWGDNFYGQVGDLSVVCRCTPVAVCGTFTFCEITTGQRGTFALNHLKLAYAWGQDTYLGINSNVACKSSPVAVCCNFSYNVIQTYMDHTCAIRTTGQAYCWGRSNEGQCGQNQTLAGNILTPTAVCGSYNFCKISLGVQHTCALTDTGLAYCWGANTQGQLGDNTVTGRSSPVPVCGNRTFCHISCGYEFTLAIDVNGVAWGWGLNTSGQLGVVPFRQALPSLIQSI